VLIQADSPSPETPQEFPGEKGRVEKKGYEDDSHIIISQLPAISKRLIKHTST